MCTECTIVDPCVADAKWQDPEQDIKSTVAHAHIQGKKNKLRMRMSTLHGKSNCPLRMCNLREIYIWNRFVAVLNCTFHARSRKVSCVTRTGRCFQLAWSLQHEPASRIRLVTARLGFALESRIALIPQLLHNILSREIFLYLIVSVHIWLNNKNNQNL